jgi:hypothetical protein
MSKFNRATRRKVFLKLAITGPAGSIKTLSALLLATGLAGGGKIAMIDTENKSAAVYSDRFTFYVLDISPPFTEQKFIEAIEAAVSENCVVLIIDSLSHAWLEILDFKAGLDAKGGNTYTNWSKAGGKFNKLMAAILQSQIHLICCMRSKMEYVLEPDIRGKMVPRKVGLAPVMRDGIEYEYSTIFEGDMEHFATVTKDRTGLFVDQRFQVTQETGRKLLDWLNPAPEAEMVSQKEEPETPQKKEEAISTVPAQRLGICDTPQEQLRQALDGFHPDEVLGFLVSRKQITVGQTIADLSSDYCEKALARLPDFRQAITTYGQEHDAIVMES